MTQTTLYDNGMDELALGENTDGTFSISLSALYQGERGEVLRTHNMSREDLELVAARILQALGFGEMPEALRKRHG